ncbi:MADS-box protein SOC1 [Bienertia sinuspersici]
MVRGNTQMRRIENDSSRQVAFTKRRNGLLKKLSSFHFFVMLTLLSHCQAS